MNNVSGRRSGINVAAWPVIHRAGAAAILACCIGIVAVMATVSTAGGAASPTGKTSAVTPRLASLLVDIWPEYDRQAVLVILKAELSADTPLPAALSLRIPTAPGGPSAVAFAEGADARLLNLQHDVTTAGNVSLLKFSVPQRFFHIEYYDNLVAESNKHAYTYVWPGDLAVDRVSVRVQEPATARELSVVPDLGPGAVGEDGLSYRTRELGAYAAGKPLSVAIRYAKSDPRTSAEILKLNVPAAMPSAPTLPASGPGQPLWAWLAIAAVGLMMFAVALRWFLRWRRTEAGVPQAAAFCTKCGGALASDYRYCPACGTPAQRHPKSR